MGYADKWVDVLVGKHTDGVWVVRKTDMLRDVWVGWQIVRQIYQWVGRYEDR